MSGLSEARRREREKYVQLYADQRLRYGSSNHGRDAVPLLLSQSPTSILDVGCGRNSFARSMRASGVMAVGVDHVSPSADVIAAAHALPFPEESFEWLTAFDVLEHLLTDEIDEVLEEFCRVASVGWLFSICYRDSVIRVNGETMHPTVRPEEWWRDRLSQWINVESHGPYLWGSKWT